MPAVSGLEQEFPGRVQAKNLDATLPESVKDVQTLGFKNHGLVIRSADGTVLWKQPDHQVRIEDVRTALRGLIHSS